jgi:nitrite reductase/ring-hydroxylating ferredoxin subunit
MSATNGNDDTSAWENVAHIDELDPDYPTMVTAAGVEMALCKVGDAVFAVNNICSHAFSRLSDGFLDGAEVFCPLHHGSFDVRTGQAIAAPCFEPIAVYPVNLSDGQVFVCPFPSGPVPAQ